MATLLPPPKRQRSAYSQWVNPPAPAPAAAPIPSIVVQFKSSEDGSNLGPAINLPADTGRDALQMLVNKLKGEVCALYLLLLSEAAADVGCLVGRSIAICIPLGAEAGEGGGCCNARSSTDQLVYPSGRARSSIIELNGTSVLPGRRVRALV
jgi:ribosome assembly protein 4